MLGSFALPKQSRLPDVCQRLQDELQSSLIEFRNGLMASQGALSMNVYKKDNEFLIRLELPGVTAEDIEVDVVGEQVRIAVERKQPEQSEGSSLKQERPFGRLQREMQFASPIDTSKTEASFEKGILELKLVIAEELAPKRVPVQGR
ncbi:Hsp20/alpha crystallin family protein [Rubinisphaera margarita]|uniref:Hsp20/alpha crystallin family protein n=1 Tax=Rubinisphaera margarita TaxID=2909586 RepID=UPI001EE88756|nr:Hsp20/alpha crystallin family protein [Rubinisphaera margarita]MCG6157885.1 Hsp20/alpha crystallin family protein [Rubinisphaera margarita]